MLVDFLFSIRHCESFLYSNFHIGFHLLNRLNRLNVWIPHCGIEFGQCCIERSLSPGMYSRNGLFYRQITAIESVLRRKFPLKKANELKPSAQTEIRYRNFRFESADQNAESNPLIPLPYDQRYRITSSQVLILAAYTAIICGRLVVNQIRKEPIVIGSDNLHPHSWAEQLGFLFQKVFLWEIFSWKIFSLKVA